MNHNIIEAIKRRFSARTYRKEKLNPDDFLQVQKMIDEIKQMKGPFGHSIDLFLFDQELKDEKEKIGTYGVIKNATLFIGGMTKNEKEHLIDFGYIFEYLILRLTSLNIGTVWLGGTFTRKKLLSLLRDDLMIPAITPIGYCEEQRSFMDHLFRRLSKGDLRKPIDELFFYQDFNQKIKTDQLTMNQKEYFDLIRFAPSASNKQPWRLIVTDNQIDLFIERTKNYGKVLTYDIQLLDMGIVLCHIVYGTLKKTQIKYDQSKENLETETKQYILSVLLKNEGAL